MNRRWPTIISLWLLGVLAAAQLAKISTLVPLLRPSFGLSLPEAGLLISLLEVGGGVFGFVAGLALSRIGCRRSLLAGMILLVATGAIEGLTHQSGLLFGARAVEGIGYLLVVIAAPTAIAAAAHDADRSRALALWSSFVPIGLATGGALTSAAVVLLGPSGVMMLWAGLLALATVAASRLPVGDVGTGRIVLPAPGAWIATFAFGLYTLFVCAFTMLLPTFLIEQRGATVSGAGFVTAIASLSALPGAGFAMLMTRDGELSPRRLIAIALPTLAATALFLPPIFAERGEGLMATGVLAVLALALSGLVSPLMFARLPALAGAKGAHDPRIATANGLLTQFGAGGALIGPPIGGWVVRMWGWPMLGTAVAITALCMLVTMILAEWVCSREAKVMRLPSSDISVQPLR